MTTSEQPSTGDEAQGAPRVAPPGLTSETAAGRARRDALAAVSGAVEGGTTSLVDYRCEGRVLVIGPEPYAMEQATALAPTLRCAVLAVDSTADPGLPPAAVGGIQVVRAALTTIEGYLGHFTVTARHGDRDVNVGRLLGHADGFFDLILDLQRTPALRAELPPPGYYAPGSDPAALHRATAEMPEMLGEFQKPVYLAYDPDLCAHARSGVGGCTRCLDTCPSGALGALGDGIAIDTHLCQGAGSCAAACPSGAIGYVYSPRATLLGALREVLRRYREAGGDDPVILLHGAKSGAEQVRRAAPRLPERVIPWAVEEVGRIGIDSWLALIAYGAGAVWVLVDEALSDSVRAELDRQRAYAVAILQGMGYPSESLRLLDALPGPDAAPGSASMPAIEAAGFAPPDEKRTLIRLAVDHLHALAPGATDSTPLPAGAPFGAVAVDAAACTLCMSCVEVCPAAALEAGGDTPRLMLVEQNCLQCGICERACPEDAITLVPSFLYDVGARRERRVLHEEAPFRCVVCVTPFATRKVIERMREKLADHPMFREPGALRRLEMCGECRVKDMMGDTGGSASIQ